MKELNPQVILILAPHTDDAELGAGASLAKWITSGREVHYATFSHCAHSLPRDQPADILVHECRAATAELGLPSSHLHFFDFEVRRFPQHRQEILEALVRLNKQLSPGMVVFPAFADVHQDHGTIHAEALRAFKNAKQLGYELPWNNTRFFPTYFESVNEKALQTKMSALKQYRSQAHRNYMNEAFIRSLAVVRGVQAGVPLAEAFELYKWTH